MSFTGATKNLKKSGTRTRKMKTGKQPQTKRPKEERLAKDHVQYLKQWILVLVKLRTSQIKTLVETGDVHFT